ncbi:MAG: hypothetical protein ABIJ82_03025 [Patescibacteria group bacterium]|nr:hypothetical protein [Patescibacteria group bacterium]MBU1953154.1 hypothetical protein [Patescibacteria group bacterium]
MANKPNKPDVNWQAYEKDKDRLLGELLEGTYVAYVDGTFVASGVDLKLLFEQLDTKYPNVSCFVHKLCKEEPVHHI